MGQNVRVSEILAVHVREKWLHLCGISDAGNT